MAEASARTRYTHSLLSSPNSIRLIKLEPHEFTDGAIRVQLVEMNIQDPQSYEALSYTWDAQKADRDITCHDHPLAITANCAAALRRLRHTIRNRMLWIDAICIDQYSNSEKNQQVPLMGQIYTKASKVIVWLGHDSQETDAAIRYLSRVASLCISPNQFTQGALARATEELHGMSTLSSAF